MLLRYITIIYGNGSNMNKYGNRREGKREKGKGKRRVV